MQPFFERRPLAPEGLSALGSALIGLGALPIVAGVRSAAMIGGSICRGAGEGSSASMMFTDTVHCWGCPVALVGAALVAAALVLASARRSGLPGLGANLAA